MSDDKKDPVAQEPPTNPPVPDAKPEIDPLALGKKFRREGDFVVDAAFDVTMTPTYKKLNDSLVALAGKSETDRSKLTEEINSLRTQLSDKHNLSAEESARITSQIDEMRNMLTVQTKEAQAAQVELLKVQTAASMGLPYNYVKYIVGENPESIKTSAQTVLEDFKLQSSKFTQDDLNSAIALASEKTAKETEERLKTVGKPTEGAGKDEHVYTRIEIAAMSLAEYKNNRAVIQKQLDEGKVK
jgi:hypothetical protein